LRNENDWMDSKDAHPPASKPCCELSQGEYNTYDPKVGELYVVAVKARETELEAVRVANVQIALLNCV
jgi:hypothetical protein